MSDRKPVTIECYVCRKTIYEDEKWGQYGEDAMADVAHEACFERESKREAARNRAEIARIIAKEKAGEELTFDELMTLDLWIMHENFMRQMASHATGVEIPHIGRVDEPGETVLRPKVMYAAVKLRKGE